MKITTEQSLSKFKFRSGAKTFAELLTARELDQIELILQQDYDDGITDAQLNDLFDNDSLLICEWLSLDIGEVYSR